MESKAITKIGVLTSGGDAPGMNAAIRAVVRCAFYYNLEVYGIYRGYEGMIQNDIRQLNSSDIAYVLERGGTFLKSARSAEFRTPEGRKKAYENLQQHGINGLVVIGGDGSLTGAHLFYKEFGIPAIGLPGTIDNDLSGTDNTIGFDTACNTAIEAIDKIRDTATSHDRLFFVEVMGRDSGFIAINAGIGSAAAATLIPEKKMPVEALIDRLNTRAKAKKQANVVIVAEGGKSGGALEISKKVKKYLPNYDIKVTILGHLQRGGSPTSYDRVLASKLGVSAVEGLMQGKCDVMAGVINNKVVYTPIKRAIVDDKEVDEEDFRVAKILST
ncbi:6-phosphofructokinase [Echinicola vietnamensis]|uniref:ATP-dependent 6-phosphofructokinase n=1 Tax=Echinicola vietnamensis (strain DSM 17526 / LMG 23754 / KMM 6221) TaxID=926556 RepID=L0G016_ECHVK|nr:6-phosphofructokinase [Echinicola vietnamensis]AGA78628.1 6-phosphofructokinase [Echinicola vietnamensis DSM 17526]